MIKAIIFDMDGVISDTESIYGEVTSAYLKQLGIDMAPRDTSLQYAGIPWELMFQELFQKHGVSKNVKEASHEVLQLSLQAFEHNIRPIPGSLKLIQTLCKKGFKLGVASGARMFLIERTLSELNVKQHFHALTSGEEVNNPKPHPDIFLLTAQRLGVKPEECVVIEDGIHGMIGAKKAGMKVIGLDIHRDLPETCKMHVDGIIHNLEELTVEKLFRI